MAFPLTDRPLRAVVLTAILVVSLPGPLVSGPATLPFLEYLRAGRGSLVAFSPTNHDPRSGADYRAPNSASILADLRALRPAFDGIILYGYDKNVTPHVVSSMRQLGYRALMLGIWNPSSEDEIAGVAELANQVGDSMAVAIAIGNEGVAFNRYRFEDVKMGADRVKRRLKLADRVAICTSEPFSQYGFQPLQAFGDFLAPNIHPVFDKPELGPAEAAAWTRDRAMALAGVAKRPILVKETGFPHGGDRRFSPARQAEFWKAYLAPGRVALSPDDRTIWVSHVAAFESFNLPWKAAQSKIPIEEFWGLMSVDRKPYPAFGAWQALQKSGGKN